MAWTKVSGKVPQNQELGAILENIDSVALK
jgi:hypothetical protein